MYSKTRIKDIQRLLKSIGENLKDYEEESQGFYFDYDAVESLIIQASATMSNTLRCQKPNNSKIKQLSDAVKKKSSASVFYLPSKNKKEEF